MRVTWSPPDPASKLKLNGKYYSAGEEVDLTDEQIAGISAAWFVEVKRSDLINPGSPESIENSAIRSSTVAVPVPVLRDESGAAVGNPEFDMDAALDAAGLPGIANPTDAKSARKRRAPHS